MNKATKWEDISHIISSEYRKKALKNLQNPKIPSKLSKELGINKTHISRTLKDLEIGKMVKCLVPNKKKGKIFVITSYGKKILDEISKLENQF
ncbi:MarR family transcriptional regulator [Candidatus Pacearchaeota archaeon CG10_big_fil_rev_8_21_14_0_10_34_12]|nr:MAG: MarR family transcriptional regulator [Candidatus Pacearchaeota archaeon CG10_big_fil_rev_8_21_14_0_10_34_12]